MIELLLILFAGVAGFVWGYMVCNKDEAEFHDEWYGGRPRGWKPKGRK